MQDVDYMSPKEHNVLCNMMYKIIRRGRRLVHPVSAINLTLANRELDRVCCSTLSNNT